MFETKPVGRNNVAICTNICCWLNGAEDLVRALREEARHQARREHGRRPHLPQAGRRVPGRVQRRADDDGRSRHYHENLTPEKVDEILDELK